MASILASALSAALERTDPMTLLKDGASLAASAAAVKAVTYVGTLVGSRALRGSPLLGADHGAVPPRHRVKVAHTSFTFTSRIAKNGRLAVPLAMLVQLSAFVTKQPRDKLARILIRRTAGTLSAINDILLGPRTPKPQTHIMRQLERSRLMLNQLLDHLQNVTLRDEPRFYHDACSMAMTLISSLTNEVDIHVNTIVAKRSRSDRRRA